MPADAMSYPDPHDNEDVADDDEEDDEDVDAADEDGVVYPVEETVGETGLQQFVILGLMLPLRDYFAAQARDVLVSTDQSIYRRGDPTGFVCPDIYLIDGETIAPQDVDPDGTLKERDTSDNRMYSDNFGFWLIRQPDRSLRMSPDGVTLWPTASERAASETTARLAAEAEIQRLRAELARRDAP